jgi:hypothetical protein
MGKSFLELGMCYVVYYMIGLLWYKVKNQGVAVVCCSYDDIYTSVYMYLIVLGYDFCSRQV